MTAKWLISRRTLLRGSQGAALALPLLDCMVAPRRAHAATQKRFIVHYVPGGTVQENWKFSGTETNVQLPALLKPLEPLKSRLLLIEGLNMDVTREGFGHPHSRGMGAVLTGQPLVAGPYDTCGGNAGFAAGPSIDQVIARQIGTGTKFRSLEVAVNWPTDQRDGGKAAPTNCINFSGPNQGIPMAVDPKQVWDRLFKDLGSSSPAQDTAKARDQRLLDLVHREYRRVAQRVGKEDRLRLEQHASRVEDIEKGLSAVATVGAAACKQPVAPAVLGNTAGGQNGSSGSNSQSNELIDNAMPALGKVMMDMIVMAMACDLTRVATFQWSDSQAYNTFPWLGLNENHHAYQHDHGYQPGSIAKIYDWYMQQLAYLAQRLQATTEAAGTLLDQSLIFSCSEISHPNSHSHANMPFVIVGGAGGALRTGRWVKHTGRTNNDLLVNFAQAYGINTQTFGKANFCKGPLPGLT